MKTYLTLLFVLCVIFTSQAQFDTIPATHELQEIVVEGQNQTTSSTKSVYLPSRRQKAASSDAISLLSQMAIPQLDVNPTTKTVQTSSGRAVSIFINYVPATQQDLDGLRTADVKKVEYLLFPSDPRFQGAQNVVNFIMQQYEWGGYTKLSSEYTSAVNKTFGSVYSKFSCRKMIFDLYADENHSSTHHYGSNSIEKFEFIDLNGKGPMNITRYSEPTSAHQANNINNVSLRALFISPLTQISNQVSFNYRDNLHDDMEYSIKYSDQSLYWSDSKIAKTGTNGAFNYSFSFYHTINPKLAIIVSANFDYGRNKSYSTYIADGLNIVNNAKENSHYANIAPQLTWYINPRNNLIAYMIGEYSLNKIDYYGNLSSNQKYDISGAIAGVRYTYSREKWYAGTQFGWQYAKNNLSGMVHTEETYPKGNVFAAYSPNQKNQIEILYAFGKNIPAIYQKSPNMIQQDALIWYTGNPYLKNWWDNAIVTNYTWLPYNKWQFNTTGEYVISSNRVVPNYKPDGPDGTMLRSYVNDGAFRRFRIGISATGKFFNGKLVANINPQVCFQSTTGEYAIKKNILKYTAQLTWYLKNLYIMGWYSSSSTYPSITSGELIYSPSQYQIQIGWHKGNWKASATAYDFFRNDWITSKQTLAGKYYQFNDVTYGSTMHQRFKISVSYTFNYGKKIQTGNEVGASSGRESAILK